MKVYVLCTEHVIDCEDNRTVQVFPSKESAKNVFDEFVRREKKNAEDDEWEVELDDTSFSAYVEGFWSENRVTAEISEQEMEEEKKKGYYDRCYDLKMEVVNKLQEVLGEEEKDLSKYNYEAVITEHVSGAIFAEQLESISADGFTADGEEYPFRDMALEDLCVILDKLIRGE